MKVNFLEYGGLKKAIPGKWRKALRDSSVELDPNNAYEGLVHECKRKKLKTHTLYEKLLAGKATKPTQKLEKWKLELEVTEEEKEILGAMEKNRRCTKYSKLQSFNYNFFHRNLVYEARLYKMKLAPNDLCVKCNTKETLLHLYWECPDTKALWEHLDTKIYRGLGIPTSKKMCLLGIMENGRKNGNLIRTLNQTCKYYIHRRKSQGKKRNTYGMWNAIKNMARIERTIEIERGEKGNMKWDVLQDII
jgi:hypothetical protein